MKHIVMILGLLLGLLAAAASWAQEPSPDEIGALNEVYGCLSQGLPENWGRAHVLMTLSEPGANTGNVRYMVAPLGEPDKIEPFLPCDPALPARILITLREYQAPDRRGWIGLQLEFQRSGGFRLNYEYPPPK